MQKHILRAKIKIFNDFHYTRLRYFYKIVYEICMGKAFINITKFI